MTDEVLNQETELSELLQIRRDKLDELRSLGIDPFGQKYVRTEEAGSILKKYEELTKEELEEWRQRDPIGIVEARLLKDGALTEEDVERIHREVQEEIDDSLQFAEESEAPPSEALYDFVYV